MENRAEKPKPVYGDLVRGRMNVEVDDLPIWRDSANNFSPLETLFGCFHGGCSFGAMGMLKLHDPDDKRFYSTLAVNNTYCITLSKKTMLTIVENYEKRQIDERRAFMRSIAEFTDMSHTWITKLVQPDCLEQISCIKGSVIFDEGQKLDYIYFIRDGDFEISKMIKMDSCLREESANQIMQLAKEFPEPGRITKQIKTQNQKQPKVQ